MDDVNGVESVFSRGLLYGTDYGGGESYRGIWGLYGIYDYVAPNIFRVSNTAAAFGTTSQWWLSQDVALQGTALLGVGYAGGGVIHGSGVSAPGPMGEGQRNYHYGVAPESIVALRLIMADRAALDITARYYYISRLGASESTGSETLNSLDVALTVRVFDLHGITLRYSESTRDGRYARQADSHQTVGTVSIGYTLLGPRAVRSRRLARGEFRLRSSRQSQRLAGRRPPFVDHCRVVLVAQELGNERLARLTHRGQSVSHRDIRSTTRLRASTRQRSRCSNPARAARN